MVRRKTSRREPSPPGARTKLTRAYIKTALDKAEAGLERCWSIFHGKGERSPGDVLSLQSSLLKILFDAEGLYREIAQERERLIAKKLHLSPAWFKRRQAQLERYAKSIKIILGIGRALGDGFAWMFYRDDDQLIDEHLKLQRQPLLPPGVGGHGERLFLERFQNANGTLAIYHGLTSFLRMGDFSFYDPIKKRIVAIGELKTVVNDDGSHYLHMNIIAQFNSPLMKLAQSVDPGKATVRKQTLPVEQSRRLERQVSQIITAIKQAESHHTDEKISAIKKIDMSKLQSVLDLPDTAGVRYELVGKGLMLAAIAVPASISERELGQKNGFAAEGFKGIEKHVAKIANPGATDNALIIGLVGFSEDHQPYMLPGTPPLFWWPINETEKHDLIFGRLVVVSCYNPSHFFAMLRRRGYEVVADERGRLTSAKKALPDGKVMSLEHFSYFQQMSAGYLMDEDVIENMLDVMEQKAAEEVKLVF
jgi:hypothetical protein